MPGRERLPRAARIRRGAEIRLLLRRGRRARTPLLDVYLRRGAGRSLPRIGWIVPKLGHRIVERNRLKRRLREIARRRVLPRLAAAGVGADVLVRIRRPAYRAAYAGIESALAKAVEAACRAAP